LKERESIIKRKEGILKERKIDFEITIYPLKKTSSDSIAEHQSYCCK